MLAHAPHCSRTVDGGGGGGGGAADRRGHCADCAKGGDSKHGRPSKVMLGGRGRGGRAIGSSGGRENQRDVTGRRSRRGSLKGRNRRVDGRMDRWIDGLSSGDASPSSTVAATGKFVALGSGLAALGCLQRPMEWLGAVFCFFRLDMGGQTPRGCCKRATAAACGKRTKQLWLRKNMAPGQHPSRRGHTCCHRHSPAGHATTPATLSCMRPCIERRRAGGRLRGQTGRR